MPYKVTRFEYLKNMFGTTLDDDRTRSWRDYPCIEWPYATTRNGYGNLRLPGANGKGQVASRLSFAWAHPEMDISKLHICHHCDNPPCFRPVHLFAGTREDNLQDMVAKGRYGMRLRHYGEDHNSAKLTWPQIDEIKRLRAGGWTQIRIARHFNVSQKNISGILRGKKWPSTHDPRLL